MTPVLKALMLFAIIGATVLCPASGLDGDSRDDHAAEQAQLLREIEAAVRRTAGSLGKDKLSSRVIAAIGKVPRHRFVPESLREMAYGNYPLPIGQEQTISQPYIVAIMTDLLQISADSRVLEVGTGSGYQAAILAEVAREVYSIEIVEPLGLKAMALLEQLGYQNIHVRIGDGFAGWPEYGPFDAIIVTAAADEPPAPLIKQLKPGGRMIIPLETGQGYQNLVVIEKDTKGSITTDIILQVRFVPLTGEQADTIFLNGDINK